MWVLCPPPVKGKPGRVSLLQIEGADDVVIGAGAEHIAVYAILIAGFIEECMVDILTKVESNAGSYLLFSKEKFGSPPDFNRIYPTKTLETIKVKGIAVPSWLTIHRPEGSSSLLYSNTMAPTPFRAKGFAVGQVSYRRGAYFPSGRRYVYWPPVRSITITQLSSALFPSMAPAAPIANGGASTPSSSMGKGPSNDPTVLRLNCWPSVSIRINSVLQLLIQRYFGGVGCGRKPCL